MTKDVILSEYSRIYVLITDLERHHLKLELRLAVSAYSKFNTPPVTGIRYSTESKYKHTQEI